MQPVNDEVALTKIERRVLNSIQREFPVNSRPYQLIADKLGLTEQEAYAAVRSLKAKGVVRRIGATFDARALGYVSTLVAVKVAVSKLEQVAEFVCQHSGVTHCYERDGDYNLWFTLTVRNEDHIAAAMTGLFQQDGVEDALDLPAERVFKLNVTFPMDEDDEDGARATE